MEKEKLVFGQEASRITGISVKKLKRLEEYGLLLPRRIADVNRSRVYSKDDLKRAVWLDNLLTYEGKKHVSYKNSGIGADTLRIVCEYFDTGKITSVKYYK